ncbi:MAG: septum formation initiator family protein [Bifidobacteriaceae bacterium]|jgi:hypothetical protein|nr:septum formation initiator family protein [Bifidobacteriaceae bacterium]
MTKRTRAIFGKINLAETEEYIERNLDSTQNPDDYYKNRKVLPSYTFSDLMGNYISMEIFMCIFITIICTTILIKPLNSALTQYTNVKTLKMQNAELQNRLEMKKAEIDKWNDEEYVISKAREKLHYILPGEQSVIVKQKDLTGYGLTTDEDISKFLNAEISASAFEAEDIDLEELGILTDTLTFNELIEISKVYGADKVITILDNTTKTTNNIDNLIGQPWYLTIIDSFK